MDGKWTLTVRDGPRVGHRRFETLGEAIDEMERQLDELAPVARRKAIQVGGRRFEAARQVAVRAEVSGPGGWLDRARGGVDMRGDGSAEAYTGRLRRRLVQLQSGETPYDGLRRALAEGRKS
jgi:hypothetical protein